MCTYIVLSVFLHNLVTCLGSAGLFCIEYEAKNLHLHVYSSGSDNDLQSVTQDNYHPNLVKHVGIWLLASSCLMSPLKDSLSPSAVFFLENVEDLSNNS